jgi:hypothetical protein
MTTPPEAPRPPGICRQVWGSSAGFTADYNRQRVVLPAGYSRRLPGDPCSEQGPAGAASRSALKTPLDSALDERECANHTAGFEGGDKFGEFFFGAGRNPLSPWGEGGA